MPQMMPHKWISMFFFMMLMLMMLMSFNYFFYLPTIKSIKHPMKKNKWFWKW